jgi:hypothetical protein
VIDGTAEIDVDEVGAARFGQRGGPRHLLRLVARELHPEAGLAGGPPDQRELAPPALLQAARHDHFAHEDARAELHAQAPVGQVRSLGHRRRDDGAGQ